MVRAQDHVNYDMGSGVTPKLFKTTVDHFDMCHMKTTTLARDTNRIEFTILGMFTNHMMTIKWAYLMRKTLAKGLISD